MVIRERYVLRRCSARIVTPVNEALRADSLDPTTMDPRVDSGVTDSGSNKETEPAMTPPRKIGRFGHDAREWSKGHTTPPRAKPWR